MWQELAKDMQFYHQLHFPGRAMSWSTRLRLLTRARGLWLLALHRAAFGLLQRSRQAGGRGLRYRLLSLLLSPLELVMKAITKSEILEASEFEGGIYLSDRGGIVLGARRIGAGSLIHSNVTIGMSLEDKGIPEIGRQVWIGSDSVIHGPISIGDGATILPGSVLTKSVPARVVMKGNPARVLMREFDNRSLCESLSDAAESLPGTIP